MGIKECDIWQIQKVNFSKIRDSRTSAVEFPDYDGMHQGIFVDIFPLDDVPDGSVRQNNIFQIELEIWRTIMDERNLQHDLANGAATRLSGDLLRRLLALPRQQRFAEFEKFCSNHFGTSEMIDLVTSSFCGICWRPLLGRNCQGRQDRRPDTCVYQSPQPSWPDSAVECGLRT